MKAETIAQTYSQLHADIYKCKEGHTPMRMLKPNERFSDLSLYTPGEY